MEMSMHPLHYLLIAIGFATIVTIVARARNREGAARGSIRPAGRTSIWIPLRNRIFRYLWFASLLSGIAVSAFNTAATWLMDTLSPSALHISLISTFTTLPLFLFTLPAGVFADISDRRKLLCLINLWLALVAAGIAIGNGLGLGSPSLILSVVFLLGIGFAFNGPTYMAIIPQVVSREDLPSAITLGGLQINISGIIGPAIGGLALSWLGVNFVFAINSACFLVVILVLLRWRTIQEATKVTFRGFLASLTNTVYQVKNTFGVGVVLARVSLFGIFISLIPALLPVVGLKRLELSASELGLLFTSLSIGAAFGAAFVIPFLRSRFSPNGVTIVANALLILVYFLMGCIRQPQVFLLAAGVAGIAWTVAASELWVAGQFAAPETSRGRINAVYIMASNASSAIGGLVWGAAATFIGLEITLHGASILLLITLPLRFRWSINVIKGRTQGN
jgi:MFS family permease